MKKLILIFVFNVFLFGDDLAVKYDIKFGIFGKIGEANALLVRDEVNKTYEVSMDAKAFGMANRLSGDRREYFYSKGKIYKDLLVPDVYKHIVERDRKGKRYTREKTYKFDYYKQKIEYISTSRYEGEPKKEPSVENLHYFAHNDLLTLFFNFFKIKTDKEYFSLIAVGANKEDGRVDIKIPQNRDKMRLQKALNTDTQPYIAYINQKIFSSKRGELHLALDERGYATKAILKDVVFFGDIVGEISK
ncbi:hypothetical protein CBLAS_0348 [Campylobacter blaseri]|uniref:DUF3108 domain-containing protein n=1 Tax=Campylobacter blaseri TaxID=2042961 RepID=A0A2P8R1G8_9BACT|nr:DUF3108 domain-containing protein [Campylobacter blaseri]PSM52346.1 DUF3108 domain-containing protein [Campylobacter blaseri]PSM54112.1 DUF3108 domain-containing protein [Campylobacter blaseri]QKF85556.1 hypothetical protein CBLAS_0348 [Campylobacter blaseri]